MSDTASPLRLLARPTRLPARGMLALVKVYQLLISPFFTGGSCRFIPSCSAYAEEAVSRYGAAKGSWLAFRRICRCHPFGSSGPDPVPEPPQGNDA